MSLGMGTTTRHILSNGIVALIQPNPASPTVSVRGEIQIGAVHEPTERAGLAVFTAPAMMRGTVNRTFQQIVTETEERGCSVNFGGGMHTSGFGGKALAEDLPLVLEVLADVLINPTFPPHEIEKLRGQFLMNLRESEQENRTQAGRAIRRMLYPPEHPYSRSASGTIETVQDIQRDHMVAFHQYYHPSLLTIAIVGDVDTDTTIAMLEQVFHAWCPSHTPPALDLAPVPPLTEIQRCDIPMDGKVQSDIIWAVHGIRRTNPDYYAALMANFVLGQLGMGGRLGDNIREQQGMAYSIGSSLDADIEAGPWLAIAGVNPVNVERTLDAIVHEIRQFQQEGPTAEELNDARAYLTGTLVLRLETNDGIAGMLLGIERYGLGLDYVARYPDIIRGVEHDAIVAVARAYLSTERYAVAVAGPALDSSASA